MQGLHSIRLFLPDAILDDAWIAWDRDGRVTGFGAGAPPYPGLADGAGDFVSPGFVDIHVHGGNGADFLDLTPEAFTTISAFHLAGGTTALAPTLATAPYDALAAGVAVWEQVRTRTPGHLLGLHLEGPHLAASKAGAQDPALMLPPTPAQIDWVVAHAPAISQMTIAAELPGALEMIERASAAGIRMSLGHTELNEENTGAAVDRGASKVTHLFNAMSYAAKRGVLRKAGLAEYALGEDRLLCELIADGFHASPAMMRLAYRAKGPGRLALVSDALAGTGLPKGTTFRLGRLLCRMDEGVCMLADGSALSGSGTRLIDQIRILHRAAGVPLADAVRMATATPAAALGAGDRHGRIAEGRAADLVRFDSGFAVRGVWVGGRPVAATA